MKREEKWNTCLVNIDMMAGDYVNVNGRVAHTHLNKISLRMALKVVTWVGTETRK